MPTPPARLSAAAKKGNGCGHNPLSPRLSLPSPMSKGAGGLPRILSLAAERIKGWYGHPAQCPQLTRSERRADQSGSPRRVRSERREAWQIMLETVFSLMDLNTHCLGTPTPGGFIDADMKKIAAVSGMSKRRCERALRDLAGAGFIKVKARSGRNALGNYFGLTAIRQVAENLFEMIRLLPMLRDESKRAYAERCAEARRLGLPVSKFFARLGQGAARALKRKFRLDAESMARRWNQEAARPEYLRFPYAEACRRINKALGFPEGYAPGSA